MIGQFLVFSDHCYLMSQNNEKIVSRIKKMESQKTRRFGDHVGVPEIL